MPHLGQAVQEDEPAGEVVRLGQQVVGLHTREGGSGYPKRCITLTQSRPHTAFDLLLLDGRRPVTILDHHLLADLIAMEGS